MDPQAFLDLKVENEHIKRRLAAVEQALLNLVGFYIVTGDSSEQGLLKYSIPVPGQSTPEPVVP
jgi:hypothetical protein